MKKLVPFLLGGLLVLAVGAMSQNGFQLIKNIHVDANGRIEELDPKGYGVTLDVEHHKIHEGELYTASYYTNDLDIAAPMYLAVVVPAGKNPHVFVEFSTSGAYVRQFITGGYITGGVALGNYNQNHTSANTSTVTVYAGGALAGGVTNRTVYFGSNGSGPQGSRSGGTSRGNEKVLVASSTNIWKITPISDNTLASGLVSWYE